MSNICRSVCVLLETRIVLKTLNELKIHFETIKTVKCQNLLLMFLE